MLSVITFVIVFGLLVFIHELGHFLAAKFFGVSVTEFAFGFPPRIWSKKVGETSYALNLIPIGGYVRLLGEDGEGKKNDKSNYLSKKPWQKVIILGAGVIMNFLLAYVLLTAFYLIGGKPLLPDMWKHPQTETTQKVIITEVEESSPAAQKGLDSDDLIKRVDGKEVYTSAEVFTIIQGKTADGGPAVITLDIERDGKVKTQEVKTYEDSYDQNGEEVTYQRIGITMREEGTVKSKWYAAPYVALLELGRILKLTLVGLSDFVSTLFTQFKLSEGVGGPVAIFVVTGAAASIGLWAVIQVVIILSATLALVNIMPLPALDGGHILFLMVEKVTGREIPASFKEKANSYGFILLILLLVALTFKDVVRFGIFDLVKGVLR